MKKAKLSKEEKELNKFKKSYEKLCKLYGKDNAHTIINHLIVNGCEIGTITEEEKNSMFEIMKGVDGNEY